MSFTAQRASWEATSEQHGMRAKMEREGFYVQKMGPAEVMDRANVEDIDDLGFLMLVTYSKLCLPKECRLLEILTARLTGVDGVNDWILRTALIDS